jgi:Xaa-Pro aminopeptidase
MRSVRVVSLPRLGDATLETQLIEIFVLNQVKTHLEENGIEIKEYTEVSLDAALLATDELDYVSTAKGSLAEVTKESENLPNETNKIVNGRHQTGEKSSNLIWADPGSCCYALYSKLNPDTVHLQQSPLALPKALKVVYT